jgi:hypothetical protein
MLGEVLSHLNLASIYSLGMVDKTTRQRLAPWFKRVPLSELIRSAVKKGQANVLLNVLGPRFFALSPSGQAGIGRVDTSDRDSYWANFVETATLETFAPRLLDHASMTHEKIPLLAVWSALLSSHRPDLYRPLVHVAARLACTPSYPYPDFYLPLFLFLLENVPDDAIEFVVADMLPALLDENTWGGSHITRLVRLLYRPTPQGLKVYERVHRDRVSVIITIAIPNLLMRSYDETVKPDVRDYLWQDMLPWLLRIAEWPGAQHQLDLLPSSASDTSPGVMNRIRTRLQALRDVVTQS